MKKEKTDQLTPRSKTHGALVEGIDYEINDSGLMVLTKEFHLKRGHCCHSGCQNCPFEYSKSIDPNIPVELQLETEDDDYLKYLEGDFD